MLLPISIPGGFKRTIAFTISHLQSQPMTAGTGKVSCPVGFLLFPVGVR